MQLKEFSLINPIIESSEVFKAIETAIPSEMIEDDGEPKTYRLITSLIDIVAFPALLLATEYHQRWEIER